jgi:AcrR family transcriptional regulator
MTHSGSLCSRRERGFTAVASDAPTTSTARRKTRSRTALLRAAQDLIASGATDMSVKAVTELAEVSPQTLYNQFPHKEALLAEAKASALVDFETYMFERGKDITVPLEQFALNLRLFGRAPDTHPHFAAVIANSPLWVLVGKTGYSPVFAAFTASLIEAGLLAPEDVEFALVSTAASLEHIVVLRLNDPSIPESRVDDLVFRNLLHFGISRARARRLISKPLPTWPHGS